MKKPLVWLTALLLGAMPPMASAYDFYLKAKPKNDNYDEEANRKEDLKTESALPAAPKAANLLEYFVEPTYRHKAYIDPDSVSVDGNRVVKMTVIVHTAGGARNVSYDGFACENNQHITYAVGRPDGSWVPAREPKWHLVNINPTNRHLIILYRDFLCDTGFPVGSAKQILENIRADRRIDAGRY